MKLRRRARLARVRRIGRAMCSLTTNLEDLDMARVPKSELLQAARYSSRWWAHMTRAWSESLRGAP